MAVDTVLIGTIATDAALAVAFGIFIFLTIRHNLADVSRFMTFKFWLSVAVILWLVGEVFFSGLGTPTGRIVHLTAMVMFPVIILGKAYSVFLRRR